MLSHSRLGPVSRVGGECPRSEGERGPPSREPKRPRQRWVRRRGDPHHQQSFFKNAPAPAIRKVRVKSSAGRPDLGLSARACPWRSSTHTVEVLRAQGSEDRGAAVRLFSPKRGRPRPRPLATPPRQVVLPDLLSRLPLSP